MSNNKYKVLIIEDEQNINNLLDTLMQANGYQTIIATSCGSGLMMYASHRPDIVILDLGLPDKDPHRDKEDGFHAGHSSLGEI